MGAGAAQPLSLVQAPSILRNDHRWARALSIRKRDQPRLPPAREDRQPEAGLGVQVEFQQDMVDDIADASLAVDQVPHLVARRLEYIVDEAGIGLSQIAAQIDLLEIFHPLQTGPPNALPVEGQ